MKNYKRAYRRHKKHVKFLRRLKNWIKPGERLYFDSKTKRVVEKSREDIIESALRGECYTWLRTTGRPCNCYMCSTYEKYTRDKKQDINKDIWNQILDNLNNA